jgi:DNA repair protein RecO (recombination protein O)
MEVFSKVEVGYTSRTESSLGFWKKFHEEQRWIYLLNSPERLLLCQSVCYVLSRVLPQNFQYQSLFRFVDEMSRRLPGLATNAALGLYAHFEFLLLNTIGFGFDLKRCGVCGQFEEVSYVSRGTCHCVSRQCASSLRDDELLAIPNCWRKWASVPLMVYDLQPEDLRTSLEITELFLREHVGVEQNYFRASMLELL